MGKGLAKKLIMIGFDGGNPPFIERFISERRLTNISRILENGAYSESLPVFPCDTPTNWTTLVTGAWPGTHGVSGFHLHLPNEPLGRAHFSIRSYWSKAEFLWDAAERSGKKTAAIMWPNSFPYTCKSGIFVDGTGPGDPQWRIAYSAVYTTRTKPESKRVVGAGGWSGIPVEFVKAEEWVNVPQSYSPVLETVIQITGTQSMIWTESGWEFLEETNISKNESEAKVHHILLIDTKGSGYNKILITKKKNASHPVAELEPLQWSDWIYETLKKIEHKAEQGVGKIPDSGIPSGTFPSYFKYKLIELTPDASVFKLYRTDIFMSTQWAYPEGMTEELIQNVGPFIEGLELSPPTLSFGDWDTYFESIDMQVDWQTRAATYLHKKYRPDLLLVQSHIQDAINHQLSREIDNNNPNYDPEKAEIAWERFARTYEDVDELVGGIIEQCSDNETLVVVVSDHGALPTYKTAWVGVPLIKEGLLAYTTDPKTGKTVVDWSKTQAYPWRTNIYVNLKGRYTNGIVEPKNYENIRDSILKAIYGMRDPQTKECPIALAIRREDAEAWGQWSDRVGDVLYYLKPGYTDTDFDRDNVTKFSVERIYTLKEVEPSYTRCSHGQFLPTMRSGGMANRAVNIMMGPGVKKGYRRRTPIWQVDVIPTICYALGIGLPAQSDGKVIIDYFEDF